MNSVSIGFSRALHCEMRAGDRHGANVRNGITAPSGDRPPVLLLPPRLFSKIFAALHSGLWIHRRAHLVWPAEPSSGSSGPRFGLSRSFSSSECSNKNSATRKGNCAKQCQRTLRKRSVSFAKQCHSSARPGRFHNGFGTDRGLALFGTTDHDALKPSHPLSHCQLPAHRCSYGRARPQIIGGGIRIVPQNGPGAHGGR